MIFDKLTKKVKEEKKIKEASITRSLKRYATIFMINYFNRKYGLSFKEVEHILDEATHPCIKENPDKEKSVGDFIKDNIINKKSEYPEYDKATFVSTMNDLNKEAEKSEYKVSYMNTDEILDCLNMLEIGEIDKDWSHAELVSFLHKTIKRKRSEYRSFPHSKEKVIDQLKKVSIYVDIFENLKHVYIINGYARSGKDTFIKDVAELIGENKVMSISSVQGIKDLASEYFGYDEKRKDAKDRKFLADMKNLTTEYCDYSMTYILKEIIKADIHGYSHIFIHIREPKEIERACEEINYMIFPHFSEKIEDYKDNKKVFENMIKFYAPRTIFVSRDTKRITNNSSDLNVENYTYDYHIKNDESLDALKIKADKFVTIEREYMMHCNNIIYI